MAVETAGAMAPVMAVALVGVLGVGAQWLAWRLRLPAIVLMLAAGLIVGPFTGIFEPSRDIGAITQPLIALAVAVILFEGGLSLNIHQLGDAATGVRRLVYVGAPLGWLLSALCLHFVAGLSWESSAVFGGIMVVTGPTVIAPLLRQAKLSRRPASLLQWEAIVNDPIGGLAAVLAFEFVLVLHTGETLGQALGMMIGGIIFAGAIGWLAGFLTARAFKRAWVPEYMKVPVLFAVLLIVFAGADAVLHESGLLAVTMMGIVIANARLPSFEELRRFKEHATILLVSGVFILLAAQMQLSDLAALDWRAALFVVSIIVIARPLTVLLALIGTKVPRNERLLVAMTGPRGVVLVAVAGLFGERLTGAGIEDAALIGPLAFVLVLSTVVLHGFTLTPLARALGLSGSETPGVLIVGGSRFSTALAEALKAEDYSVLIADPNHARIVRPRASGIPTFYGDILGEAAELNVELLNFGTIIAATDNDAYNTLVSTDLGPEFGRENSWQLTRAKEQHRHALPPSLGGRGFGAGKTFAELDDLMRDKWQVRVTTLTEEFGYADWRANRPNALLLARITKAGELRLPFEDELEKAAPGSRLIALRPPEGHETAMPTPREGEEIAADPDKLPG